MSHTIEIKEEARKALQRGERKVRHYWIYTAKVDLDVKLVEEEEKKWWELTRANMLSFFGHIIVDVITTETDRGMHTIINYLSDVEISDKDQNFIQLLLGDDQTRFKINRQRLERGISMEKANILFSRVLQRFTAAEESKLKRAVERIVGEIG
jgi:ABC-type histidine transport system ATPase subunit